MKLKMHNTIKYENGCIILARSLFASQDKNKFSKDTTQNAIEKLSCKEFFLVFSNEKNKT
jgi:hypothetical protein